MGFLSSIGNSIGRVIGSITGATQQADAASQAAATQAGSAGLGIAEQRRHSLQKREREEPLAGLDEADAGSITLAGQDLRPLDDEGLVSDEALRGDASLLDSPEDEAHVQVWLPA